ncbi:MAG TPA: hypothetical protein VN845_05320 [Solirubrobacteraceae bacterium]|nr:hypothetical protein [Solirubrobacteraceae bacterium]
MKKFYVLGLALVAVCAVGVMSAAGASADVFLLAEWLESGSGITATLLVEITGELALTETLDGIKINALCSGILDGFIGPDGADEITELLNLAGEAISLTGLSGVALTCTNSANCGEPLAWALELPWLTLLVLLEEGDEVFFADLLVNEKAGGSVGYEVECMSLGISDTCKVTEAAALVENEGGGIVNIEFSDAFTELAGLKLANCEVAGTEVGIVEGLGLAKVAGVTLTVSE